MPLSLRKPKPPKGFVLIPAGSFMMGSPKTENGRDNDEELHRVKLTRSFYAQQTQVTQAQWKELMGTNPSYFKEDSLSVENVNWFEACDRRTLWCGAIKNVQMHFLAKKGFRKHIN